MNNAINEVKRLRRRDYRQQTGLTIVEGYPEVTRAIKAKVPFKTLYICPEIFTAHNDEFDGQPVVEVSKKDFSEMAFGQRLKGILGVAEPKIWTLSDLELGSNPLIIVVESVEKPGNLGTIIRSCDGAGATALINCDQKTDLYNHNIVRSSIGTVFHLPNAEATKEETLGFLKKANITIFATSAKADSEYSECDLKGSTGLVIGNEHDGISPFWAENADKLIKIPMKGESSSLNAGVSASILTYEALRQRSKKLAFP